MVNLLFISTYINAAFAQKPLTLRCKGILDHHSASINDGKRVVRDLHIDFSKKTYLTRIWSDANNYKWNNDDEWSKEIDIESISNEEIIFGTFESPSQGNVRLDRYEGAFISEFSNDRISWSHNLKCEKLNTPTPKSKTRKY